MEAESPSFSNVGDTELVFRFFRTFSRFEYALKKAGFVDGDRNKNAMPAWDRFADSVEESLDRATDSDFIEAKTFLVTEPPRKQVFVAPGMEWQDNQRRKTESESRYLHRLVRDVRNNLFHGGKYSQGPESEVARNERLLRACLTVLAHSRLLAPAVEQAFSEPG